MITGVLYESPENEGADDSVFQQKVNIGTNRADIRKVLSFFQQENFLLELQVRIDPTRSWGGGRESKGS